MLLYWLTIAVAGAVVLVLVGYLIVVAYALLQAKRNVAAIADALEEIAELTDPLDEKVGTVAGALEAAEEEFAAVDSRMDDAARAFGL